MTRQVGAARLEIRVANITTLSVDAIVNAANTCCSAAGASTAPFIARQDRSWLRRMLHGCKTGDAKVTRGYPARHVIHTVGPVWQGGDRGEDELLASCYRRAVELCRANTLASVAFPAISTGVYRFPAERAAEIAVKTTVDALPSAPTLTLVIFCCFSQESAGFHEQAMMRLSAQGNADR